MGVVARDRDNPHPLFYRIMSPNRRFFAKMRYKIKKSKSELSDTKDTFKHYIDVFEESYNKGRNVDLNLAFAAKQIEKTLKKVKVVGDGNDA